MCMDNIMLTNLNEVRKMFQLVNNLPEGVCTPKQCDEQCSAVICVSIVVLPFQL